MADEESADDASEQRLRDLAIAIPVAVLWLGIPAVILTGLWLAALAGFDALTSIDITTVTVGIVAVVGVPPTIWGVPTILAIGAGLATWVVWLVRYGLQGGGDSDSAETFAERDRQERRWDFYLPWSRSPFRNAELGTDGRRTGRRLALPVSPPASSVS